MAEHSSDHEKQQRLAKLRAEVADLEQELRTAPKTWQRGETGFYGMYHATTGLVFGMIAAFSSLLFNVIGSLIVGQHPLRLIQVYLTFPLGEAALSSDLQTGITLAVGCCLYIGTGMLLGIPFQMALARFTPNASLVTRLIFATVLGVALWLVSFYGVLSWLQPMLFDGKWIADPNLLPPWVGAATHIVFAWTMAFLFPWGYHDTLITPSN